MTKTWEYRAGTLWSYLVGAAKNRKTLFYSELAPHIGTNPRNVGHALRPIMSHCETERLPPLTSIVVNRNTGLPGAGFIFQGGKNIKEIHKDVFDYDWKRTENPFGGFRNNDTIASLSTVLLKDPDQAKRIYAQVRVRGSIQAIFRKQLLNAYNNKCSICELSLIEALEAAHIVPWGQASDEERISLKNGILLCANHHRLFDKGVIRITEDRVIQHMRESCDDYTQFHGKSLKLPKKEEQWPSEGCLQKRFEFDQ